MTRNLDFNDDNSYDDATSLSYGDINGDGTVNNIKIELTTSTGWNPIGYRISSTNTAIFAGTFNGMSNTISNLYINRTSENAQALFANTTGNIENVNIDGNVTGNALLSLLVANVTKGTISNCNANGTVISKISAGGSSYTGLLVGQVMSNNGGKILDNTSEGNVEGQYLLGGLVGYMGAASMMDNCSSISSMSGLNYVGGLVGYANTSTIIGNSHAISTITGSDALGGLLGIANTGSTVYNCYSKGTISAVYGGSGGLIGLAAGTVKNSYSTVNITVSAAGAGNIGGLIGIVGCTDCDHSTILVENSYATGNIINNSTAESGTLIGQNGASSENARTKYLTLRNSYAIGNMQGNNKVGLIGIEVMDAENLFNGGQINGTTNTGNIMGITEGTDAVVTNSYSYLQTNAMTNPTGIIVDKNTLKTSDWWINNLKLDSNWRYEAGYYPLLYKLDSNGNPTTILLDGQNKIKID